MALKTTPTFQIAPSSVKTQAQTNYISIFDYTSVYDIEAHNQLIGIYGVQSLSGMLQYMGSHDYFASDMVTWAEEGRLHTVYKDVSRSAKVFTKINHVFKKNQTVSISDTTNTRTGVISAVTKDSFTVECAQAAGLTALATSNLVVFKYGSEHQKGTGPVEGSLETDVTIHRNKPVILKELYQVNGSDATQISWISTPEGGWLWYMTSEIDARRRFEDDLETSMILGRSAEPGSDAQIDGYPGTEGLFEAVRDRGNGFEGTASTILDIDSIVKRFDAQGKIADNMFYVERDQSFDIDNLLGTLNAGYSGGISYGIFENGEEMAVNLGFRAFKRGSYNFFKNDWRILNDPTFLRAIPNAAGAVRGLMIPQGRKEVYEDYYGSGYSNRAATPFLQLKYRAIGDEDRRLKNWVTGSVGGVATDGNDRMDVHYLSERLICVVGANNFMIFEGA